MELKNLKDISYRNSSFGLIRTNPLITGNLKFTVDSNSRMWLNTIDANTILAQDMFKKFPVNPTRSYPSNVKTFFGQKNVATEIIYDVFKGVDPSKVSHDYKDQYDFSFYFAGAKYLKSVQYSERYSYFAPLYVTGCDIPEYFIIFKIPGSLNANIEELDSNPSLYGKQEYLNDMMKNAQIVKTYSMKPGTELGDYMCNKIFKDSLFPTAPLNVNFNKDCQTTWYGLSIKSGVYCGMGEYLYDYYTSEHTLKDFEYYITCGYKRNGLLYPNILNMEFLFNDDTSELFDHNRYWGLYVNSSDIDRMHIDFDLLKARQEDYGNQPKIYKPIDEFGKKQVVLHNPEGCVLEAEVLGDGNVSEALNMTDTETRICYIKDKYDSLHSIRISDEDNNIKKIKFIETEVDTKDFSGSDEVVDIAGTGILPFKNSRSSILFRLESVPSPGDSLTIYYSGGSRVDDSGKRYDVIYFTDGLEYGDSPAKKLYGNVGEYYTDIQNYDLISLDNENRGSYIGDYDFSEHLSIDMFWGKNQYMLIKEVCEDCVDEIKVYFEEDNEQHTIGSHDFNNYIGYAIQKRKNLNPHDDEEYILYLIEDIDTITDNLSNYYSVGVSGINFDYDRFMTALVNCINEFPLKSFSVFYNNRDMILVSNSYDSENGDFSIMFSTNQYNPTRYSSIPEAGDDGLVVSSGATRMNNILLVPNDFEKRITDNFKGERDYLVRSKSGYSKIKDIIHYSGNFEPGQNQKSFIDAYDIYKNYIGLVLEKDEVPVLSASKFEITKIYRPSVGLCSFYKVKDFDFDFHSTKYARVPDEEYRANMFVLPGEKLERLGIYGVVGDYKNASVEFCGETFNNFEIVIAYSIDRDNNGTYEYTFSSDNGAFLVPLGKLISDDVNIYGDVNGTHYYGEYFDIMYENGQIFGIEKYGVVERDGKVCDTYDFNFDNLSNGGVAKFFGLITGDININLKIYSRTFTFGFKYKDEGSYIVEEFYAKFVGEPISSMLFFVSMQALPVLLYSSIDESDNLENFDGYKSILSKKNEYDETKNSYIFKDRLIGRTNVCEYDVNNENYNPEYAYFSNTTGYSCKFSYINGIDIHNNPYRLNVSPVFGTSNIVPSQSSTEINSDELSNEWFYVVNDYGYKTSIPHQVFDWERNTGKISLNKEFKDSVQEYIVQHDETTGETFYKYSDVLYNSVSKSCQTFFRGVLLDFNEVDDKGVVIENSRKYDGYKFTAVLQGFPESYDKYGRHTKPPFEFVVDIDDDNKIIVFGILMYLGTAYNATYPLGRIYDGHRIRPDYEEWTYYKTDIRENYSGIDSMYGGDYRFVVSKNGDYISNIKHSDFYMYKSKKYYISEDSYSHINITRQSFINNEQMQINPTLYDDYRFDEHMFEIDGFKEYYNTFGYFPEIRDILNVGYLSSRYSYIKDQLPSTDRHIIAGDKKDDESYNYAISSASNKTISLNYETIDDETLGRRNVINIIPQGTVEYMYDIRELFGGVGYYERIFEYITLAGIKNLFESGTFVRYLQNGLDIKFMNDSVIRKTGKVVSEPIYYGKIVGFDDEVEPIDYTYTLRRFQGQYEPMFVDAFQFRKDESGTVNGVFETGSDNFGIVHNMGILKITDEGSSIFDYENRDKMELKYPYVGECTVDNRNINMMLTSWDKDFHWKYTSKDGGPEGIFGTMRHEEDDTYINNLITLPETVELSKFKVSVVDDLSSVDPKYYQVAYNSNFIDTRTVRGFISVEDVMIDKLLSMNIEKAFDMIKSEEHQEKYTESTLEDYMKAYIRTNILPLYEIRSVASYYRINNDIYSFSVSEQDYEDNIHNVKPNKDVKINKTGEKFVVDFQFPVNYDKNIELFFDVKLRLI